MQKENTNENKITKMAYHLEPSMYAYLEKSYETDGDEGYHSVGASLALLCSMIDKFIIKESRKKEVERICCCIKEFFEEE